MKKQSDVMVGIVWLAIAIFYLVSATGIKVFTGAGSTIISSRTIPYLWGICLALLSLSLIVRGVRKKRTEQGSETDHIDEPGEGEKGKTHLFQNKTFPVVATFVLLTLYAAAMKPIGFLISTFCYLLMQIPVLTPKEKRKPMTVLLVSAVSAIVIEWVFLHLLNVPLPTGIFSI